jgi:hypothetical protein
LQVIDVRGKPILKGFQVRYAGTGSAGEAVDFKSDDKGTWVLVNTTNLWYNSESLEVMGESEHEKLNKQSNYQIKEKQDVDEKEDIKGRIKRSKGKFEDVDMSNELCDGGG